MNDFIKMFPLFLGLLTVGCASRGTEFLGSAPVNSYQLNVETDSFYQCLHNWSQHASLKPTIKGLDWFLYAPQRSLSDPVAVVSIKDTNVSVWLKAVVPQTSVSFHDMVQTCLVDTTSAPFKDWILEFGKRNRPRIMGDRTTGLR
tara:strand:- start:750 stop:1184 length:435 start_codon:yes stop_codon:yes gene_type:complete